MRCGFLAEERAEAGRAYRQNTASGVHDDIVGKSKRGAAAKPGERTYPTPLRLVRPNDLALVQSEDHEQAREDDDHHRDASNEEEHENA